MTSRPTLAWYYRQKARTLRRAIAYSQANIRQWSQDAAEFEAAADAALDDGVDILKDSA